MTPAFYAKQRRDYARAMGKCQVCCTRKALPNKSTCARCDAVKASYYACSPGRHDGLAKAQRTPDRFCVECQMHGGHRDGCAEHQGKAVGE